MLIENSSRFLSWWLFRGALWRMNPNEKSVYLTFDDGPIPESTPFILDTLSHYGIKATFFLVGDNARRYPELTKKIVEQGHRLGNHTFHHLGGFKHLTSTYVADTHQADNYIHSNLFRPPHGVMTLFEYARLRKQFQVVMWDVVSRDYSRKITSCDVINNVKRFTRNGSIISFHDSLKSINKLKTALPECIEWMAEQGYEFKTL